MKTIEIKPFGVTVNTSVPADSEEFDKIAKKPGACLENALKYQLYHVYFSEVRDVVLHGRDEEKNEAGQVTQTAIKGLDETFGVERNTKPVIGKDGKPSLRDGKPVTAWDEKEEDYFQRVKATKSISDADLKLFIQSAVDQIAFDPSTAERQPRAPRKLAAMWAEHAKKFLAGGKVVELSKRLHKAIGKTFEPTGDATKDVEVLGWLLKEFSEWNAAQAMAKLQA